MTNDQDVRNNEPLVVIAVAGPAEAQMIEEMLKNNGIDCTLQGDVVSTPWPTVSDLDEVRVFVRRTDAGRAQELVDGFFTPVAKDELTEDKSELGVENPDEPEIATLRASIAVARELLPRLKAMDGYSTDTFDVYVIVLLVTTMFIGVAAWGLLGP